MRLVYIGDPPGAAGFRLAGIETLTPDAGSELEAVTTASADCALLLVSARVAAALPRDLHDRLERGLEPLFVILPDSDDLALPADRLAGVLGQLGVDT